LNTLDVSGNSNLNTVIISGETVINKGVTLEETLDVSGQTNLNTLDVSGNSNLNTVIISGETVINKGVTLEETLDVSGHSNLNTLDVSGNSNLNTLVVNGVSEMINDVIIKKNLIIDGDITIKGISTTIKSETVEISDNVILINSNLKGVPPTTLISGIRVKRGDKPDYLFVFSEQDELFKIGINDNVPENNNNLQAVATREDNPINNMVAVWDKINNKFVTDRGFNIDTNGNISISGDAIVKKKLYINSSLTVPTITGLTSIPITDNHATNKKYVDTKIITLSDNVENNYFKKSGGNVTGKIIVPELEVTNIIKSDKLLIEGNVGIGTITPSQKLDVNGDAIIRKKLYIGETGGEGVLYFGGGSSGDSNYNNSVIMSRLYGGTEKTELVLFKGNDSYGASGPDRIRLKGGNIAFETYNNATSDLEEQSINMLIDNNGDVGIGTTTPSEKLDVNGIVKTDKLLIDGNNEEAVIEFRTSIDTNDISIIKSSSYDGSRTELLLFKGNNLRGNYGPDRIRIKSSNIVFETVSSGPGSVYSDTLSNRIDMIINEFGNIGIGVDNGIINNTKLYVKRIGQGHVTMTSNGTVETGIYLDNEKASFGTTTNHNLSFYTNAKPSQLILTTQGNFGIGTTTPTQKLDVNGSVKTGGIILNNDVTNDRLNISYGKSSYEGYQDVSSVFSIEKNGYELLTLHNTNNIFAIRKGFTRLGLSSSLDDGNIAGNPKGKMLCGLVAGAESSYNTQGGFLAFETSIERNNLHGREGELTEKMRITSVGNVGIGTTTPSHKLSVNGSISSTSNLVVSDLRIKKNITSVPDDIALQQIRDLECYYYDYIDKNHNENNENKVTGFIAQQVKEIFPHAVNMTKNIIPSEYRLLKTGDFSVIDISHNEYKYEINTLDLSGVENVGGINFKFFVSDIDFSNSILDNNNINAIINEDNTLLLSSITGDPKSFIFDKKYKHIFIYGKEIDDFHYLNHDIIFATHHSGIQQLDKLQQKNQGEIDDLKKENMELKTILSDMNKLIQSIKNRLDTLENV
jgi:hypothetical protein